MKRLIIFLAVIISSIFILHIRAYASQDEAILLFLDGAEIAGLPEPPFLYKNSVLVPAREVFESAGAIVTWENEPRQVMIFYRGSLLVMTVDSTTAWLDGADIEMTVPPLMENSKVMIPLRFPAECFGFGVEWLDKERQAHLFSPEPLPEPPQVLPPETPEVITYPEVVDPADNPDDEITVPPVSDPTDVIPGMARDVSTAEIQPGQFETVAIETLLTPGETQMAAYVAVASGPISEVQKTLLEDNRLIIDIPNSQCAISGPYGVDGTVPVNGVRSSQFMDVPPVTRIVFDLQGAAEYSVSLSPDRTRITVSFAQNTASAISFSSNGQSDAVTITGTNSHMVQVYPAANPDRFIISVNNATAEEKGLTEVDGVFISGLNVMQNDGAGLIIEAPVTEWPSFSIRQSGSAVTVNFFTNSTRGLHYDYIAREIRLSKAEGLELDLNEIKHTDDYTKGRYILSLPVDGEAVWGSGETQVRDSYINSILLDRDGLGNTRLTINEARVLAVTLREDADAYVIEIRLPREVYDKIVVIDPGHPSTDGDPGSIGHGIIEAELNLSISLKLMELLDSDPNIKAYATRLDGSTVLIDARAPWANAVGDLFVSIHGNTVENNPGANGTEIFYYPHANDAWLGFSSQQFAELMNARFEGMLQMNHRGVKSATLIVLHYTTIPAILCETGFLTNAGDAALLSSETFQWQIAWALYYGIQDAFNVYTPAR